jgi:cytochrome c553
MKGAFRLSNPWPRFAWLTWAVIVGISFVLGFLLLARYQENAPSLGLWGAICRGLGITADVGPAREAAPPLRTPSRIAWTNSTLDQIRAGEAQHGSFIALNCTACHGEGGVSQLAFIPILAGLDRAAIFKQLDDYRSGKRLWGVMSAIAKALSPQDSADAAAYFAARPNGLAAIPVGGLRRAQAGRRKASPRRGWHSLATSSAVFHRARYVMAPMGTRPAPRRWLASTPPISNVSWRLSRKGCARMISTSKCARLPNI